MTLPSTPAFADPRRDLAGKGFRFARHTILCFILFSLILSLAHDRFGGATDLWVIRTGMLQDLTAEMPSGRQALVGSLAVMPLPGLAALPFLPFLKPAAYGYAYLYGLALLLALAVLPLRDLLRRGGAGRFSAPAAPVLLTLAAAGLGGSEWSDLLACLPMLILAVYLETRELPEVRALAGVFWALALLAHVAGLLLVAGRLVAMGVDRYSRAFSPEKRAVRWIQAVTIGYGLAVYLFLNWMIMGSPAYPFVTAPWWRPAAGDSAGARAELTRILARQYPDCRPVVSGVWGYTLQPLLDVAEGYHVLDFHPGKLPPDESGSLVLVIPAGRNPFVRFNDVQPRRVRNDETYASPPLFEKTKDWTFVRLDLKTVESE